MFVNNNSTSELVIKMLWSYVFCFFCCFFCKDKKVTPPFETRLIKVFKTISSILRPILWKYFLPPIFPIPIIPILRVISLIKTSFIPIYLWENYTDEKDFTKDPVKKEYYFINTRNFICLTWTCILTSRWFYVFSNNWFYKNRKPPLNWKITWKFKYLHMIYFYKENA